MRFREIYIYISELVCTGTKSSYDLDSISGGGTPHHLSLFSFSDVCLGRVGEAASPKYTTNIPIIGIKSLYINSIV